MGQLGQKQRWSIFPQGGPVPSSGDGSRPWERPAQTADRGASPSSPTRIAVSKACMPRCWPSMITTIIIRTVGSLITLGRQTWTLHQSYMKLLGTILGTRCIQEGMGMGFLMMARALCQAVKGHLLPILPVVLGMEPQLRSNPWSNLTRMSMLIADRASQH